MKRIYDEGYTAAGDNALDATPMTLKKLICIIWDSEIPYEEAVEGFSKEEVKIMDNFCRLNPTVLQEGIPMPGDDEIWDMISKEEPAGVLINKMISKFEEV